MSMPKLQQAAAEQPALRTFVDLRKFAQDESQGIAMPALSASGEDLFLSRRRILDLPPGPVTVGAISLEAGSGAVKFQPADEFIIVSEGKLTLTQQDSTLVLGRGKSVVLQHGARFSWSAEGPVSIIFMRYQGSKAGERGLVPISETPSLEPSAPPSAELLLTPTPACRNYVDHRSADGEFYCGTWDSTPYHRRAMSYRHDELIHLLEGSFTFEDEIGRSSTFLPGDIVLVARGAQCSWEHREHVAKVYAIYRPA